jgi:hypothetical protein
MFVEVMLPVIGIHFVINVDGYVTKAAVTLYAL